MGFSDQGEIGKQRKTTSVANSVFIYIVLDGKSLHDNHSGIVQEEIRYELVLFS